MCPTNCNTSCNIQDLQQYGDKIYNTIVLSIGNIDNAKSGVKRTNRNNNNVEKDPKQNSSHPKFNGSIQHSKKWWRRQQKKTQYESD